MSLVLIIIGCLLVLTGCLFAWNNRASDTAGGSGLKAFSIQGPAWLVLIVVGCVSAFFGVSMWEEAEQRKNPPTVVETTPTAYIDEDDILDEFPDGYTFGDDNYLDRLWRSCERGVFEDCDTLYYESPVGSEYEWYGATCGGFIFDIPASCWQLSFPVID